MDAKDLPGGFFVTTFRYPKSAPVRGLPRTEMGAETRETDTPFRVGFGVAVRLPLTRVAVVVGEWVGDLPGDTDEDKIRAALRGREPNISVEVIKEW